MNKRMKKILALALISSNFILLHMGGVVASPTINNYDLPDELPKGKVEMTMVDDDQVALLVSENTRYQRLLKKLKKEHQHKINEIVRKDISRETVDSFTTR